MTLYNVNARKLGNDAIFVSYQVDGKALDAAFQNWEAYVEWLKAAIDKEREEEKG